MLLSRRLLFFLSKPSEIPKNRQISPGFDIKVPQKSTFYRPFITKPVSTLDIFRIFEA